MITRPSCVKELKKIGSVKDFQFGKHFSVALTGNIAKNTSKFENCRFLVIDKEAISIYFI